MLEGIKMKKYLSRRKKRTILTALALGLWLLTPWHRAEAVTSYATPNGLFRLDYYGTGESFTGKAVPSLMGYTVKRESAGEQKSMGSSEKGKVPSLRLRVNSAL